MTANILQRLNNMSTTLMYALSVVGAAAFLSTHWLDKSADVMIKKTKLSVKNIQQFDSPASKNDVAFVTFDLEMDTKDIWNWNAKQLYM